MGPWPPKWISHRGYGRPKWELLRLTPDQQARELDQMAEDKARAEALQNSKHSKRPAKRCAAGASGLQNSVAKGGTE